MEPNPYESPRVPDGLEVRDEHVGGLPYWPFLDIVLVVLVLGVIAALLLPVVMR